MSKPAKKETLINYFNEIFNLIDNQELTDTQQLTLLHLLHRLNRNFWKPVKVSENKLAGAMNKDKRTVAKALKQLEDLQIISVTPKGEIKIVFDTTDKFDTTDETQPNNNENNRGNESEESTNFSAKRNKSSVGNGKKIEPSDSNFKGLEIFAPSET